jgi:hypothetical protein
MNAIDIVILLVVLFAVVWVVRKAIKRQAAGGCSGCSAGKNGTCSACAQTPEEVAERLSAQLEKAPSPESTCPHCK